MSVVVVVNNVNVVVLCVQVCVRSHIQHLNQCPTTDVSQHQQQQQHQLLITEHHTWTALLMWAKCPGLDLLCHHLLHHAHIHNSSNNVHNHLLLPMYIVFCIHSFIIIIIIIIIMLLLLLLSNQSPAILLRTILHVVVAECLSTVFVRYYFYMVDSKILSFLHLIIFIT